MWNVFARLMTKAVRTHQIRKLYQQPAQRCRTLRSTRPYDAVVTPVAARIDRELERSAPDCACERDEFGNTADGDVAEKGEREVEVGGGHNAPAAFGAILASHCSERRANAIIRP